MSAAALTAQRLSSDPDSTQSRTWRDEDSVNLLPGCGCPIGEIPLRGRPKHRLPCEP